MTLPAIRDIYTDMQAAVDAKDAGKLAALGDGISAAIAAGKRLKKSQGELRLFQEAYIWNMRALGLVLNEVAPHGGARYPNGNLETTLATLGIDAKLSAKSRKVAEIHQEDVRTFIEESGDELNLTFLLRLHTEESTVPAWNDDAEWRTVLAVLRDYYENGTNEDRLAKVSGWLEEA